MMGKKRNSLSDEINYILKNGGPLLPKPEWTNEIERDGEILTVDQNGNIRTVICKKHRVKKVYKQNDMHPNMSPYRESWYWECPKCAEEARKKWDKGYNYKEVRAEELDNDGN